MSRFFVAGLLLLFTSVSSHAAGTLAVPQGKVILTIEGAISQTNTSGGKATLDMGMLKDLGVRSFKTKTPWLEGVSEFYGVMMSDVMTAAGATGQIVEAFAADDYSNEIARVDFEKYNVILVLFMDGKRLDPEDKGPLWIMYPFDAHPTIDIDEKSAHAVWQLTRLVVK